MKKRTLILLFVIALIPFELFAVKPQIVPGHVINVTVLGYPELSKSVIVRQDGTTDYPLLYNIPIDGLYLSELRDLLQPILLRYVERPRLFVSLSDYLQLNVLVHGQVLRPGSYKIPGPIDLQGVLAFASGTTETADLRNIKIMREENHRRVEIEVDLYDFFLDQEGHTLPEIKTGDIIFVPMIRNDSYIRVLGEVRLPGKYIPISDETVADIIYMAGGPAAKANMNKVTLITQSEGRFVSQRVRINDYLKQGRPNELPRVRPGDIIIVEPFYDWQLWSSWVSLMRDIGYIVSTIVILSNV